MCVTPLSSAPTDGFSLDWCRGLSDARLVVQQRGRSNGFVLAAPFCLG